MPAPQKRKFPRLRRGGITLGNVPSEYTGKFLLGFYNITTIVMGLKNNWQNLTETNNNVRKSASTRWPCIVWTPTTLPLLHNTCLGDAARNKIVGGWVERKLGISGDYFKCQKRNWKYFFLPHQGVFNIFFFIQKRFFFCIHFSQKGFHFLLWTWLFFLTLQTRSGALLFA